VADFNNDGKAMCCFIGRTTDLLLCVTQTYAREFWVLPGQLDGWHDGAGQAQAALTCSRNRGRQRQKGEVGRTNMNLRTPRIAATGGSLALTLFTQATESKAATDSTDFTDHLSTAFAN